MLVFYLVTDFLVLLQALDTFNTTVVSPIYYAMFTSFTILASAIMFKVSHADFLSHTHTHTHTENTIYLQFSKI